MNDLFTFLQSEGIDPGLLEGVRAFREKYPTEAENAARVPDPEYYYYGKKPGSLRSPRSWRGKTCSSPDPRRRARTC